MHSACPDVPQRGFFHRFVPRRRATLRGRIARPAAALLSMGWVSGALAAAPFAFTQPAAPIGPTNATLNGMATPNGLDAVAWYEWGQSSNLGQMTSPTAVGSGTNVLRVSAAIEGLVAGGIYHFRLVVSNADAMVFGAERMFTTGNKAASWGGNDYGQSVPLAGVTNLVAAAGGDYGSLGVRNDGRVVAWGDLPYQQPTDLPSLSNVVAVAIGWIHEVALQSDGTVRVWGSLSAGMRNVPVDLTNAIAIAASMQHALALRSDGTVTAWGDNSSGQTNVPAGLCNVVAIGAGVWESLALKNDGTIVAWGGITNVPNGLTNAVGIAGGDYRGYAILPDRAAAILYRDLGTSKAFVIGWAFAVAGYSSFWLIGRCVC